MSNNSESPREPGFYPHPFDTTLQLWWNGDSWTGKTRAAAGAEYLPNMPMDELPPAKGLVWFIQTRPTWQIVMVASAFFLLLIPISLIGWNWLMPVIFSIGISIMFSKRVTRSMENRGGNSQDFISTPYAADRLRQPM